MGWIKKVLFSPVKWLICDFFDIHLYRSYSGSFSLESDDDGDFEEEIYYCCDLCGDCKEVIKITRDKILDDQDFIILFDDYVKLIRKGVRVSEYGIFITDNQDHSVEVISEIHNFNSRYLSLECRFKYVGLSTRLYKEAKKKGFFKR